MPIISIIIGPITFIIAWIYVIGEFGFFLGFGLGWIPALFIGYFFAVLTKMAMLAVMAALSLGPLREVTLAEIADRRLWPDSSFWMPILACLYGPLLMLVS